MKFCALNVAVTAVTFGLSSYSVSAMNAAETSGIKIELPSPLSAKDAQLYREVFALQRKGAWGKARARFKKIEDKSLQSHVLYLRYMHPTKYRARFKELNAWLKKYASHPGARQIHRLAKKRRPKLTVKVPVARLPRIEGVVSEEIIVSDGEPRVRSRSKKRSWRSRQLARQVNRLVARRKAARAHQLIQSKRSRKILGKDGLVRAEAAVARGFYHLENNKRALNLADRAADRAPAGFGDAHWWAGLASWRLAKFDKAAGYFARLADDAKISVSLRTAAGFWAARSYLQSQKPDKVNHYLSIAAKKPRTFYGLLATQLLGYTPKFNWHVPRLLESDVASMVSRPRLRRALALIQVGERVRAEAEMKFVPLRGSEQEIRILLNIASHGGLPRLSYRLGHAVMNAEGRPYDAALYPLPVWQPKRGFQIDRALVFAMIRQESRFRSRARSRMGATGLMQLMPRTARAIAGRKVWNGRRSSLFEPVLNITLGQKYLRHLLDQSIVKGDLFYTIAAYNGGPGNLYRWQKKVDYQSDSLLFIESIPARETRAFIEQVLANYWIYRLRLNQPAPSLGTLAAGEWPTYIALDPGAEDIANSAR
ncbi:MAG TPA: transglycosylase [Rhodospirillaceae bacterium]|nr:transglycosylase [Rhodospirillaceae bacterium]HAT36572.1 transglycosylase [Rhodospirillaceae bacterium]